MSGEQDKSAEQGTRSDALVSTTHKVRGSAGYTPGNGRQGHE